jgi:hypothetical protein
MRDEAPSPGQVVWIDIAGVDCPPVTGTVERVSAATPIGRVVVVRLATGKTTGLQLSLRGQLWATLPTVPAPGVEWLPEPLVAC